MAIKDKDIVDFFRTKVCVAIMFVFPVIVMAVSYIGYSCGDESTTYQTGLKVVQLTCLPFWIRIGSHFTTLYNFPKSMVTATFFVFLYHYCLAMPNKLISVLGGEITSISAFLYYIAGVIIEIGILLFVYYFLNRFCNKFLTIVVGGR